jgi:hypothetical protein
VPAGLSNLSYTASTANIDGFDYRFLEAVLVENLGFITTYLFYPDELSALVGLLNQDCDLAAGGIKLASAITACADLATSGVKQHIQELPSSDYGTIQYASRKENVTCLDFSLPYTTSGYALMSRPMQGGYTLVDAMLSVTLLNVVTPIFVAVLSFGILIYALEHSSNPSSRTLSDTLYFAFVTVATVGFGDITPTTRGGRVATVFMIVRRASGLLCACG